MKRIAVGILQFLGLMIGGVIGLVLMGIAAGFFFGFYLDHPLLTTFVLLGSALVCIIGSLIRLEVKRKSVDRPGLWNISLGHPGLRGIRRLDKPPVVPSPPGPIGSSEST